MPRKEVAPTRLNTPVTVGSDVPILTSAHEQHRDKCQAGNVRTTFKRPVPGRSYVEGKKAS